MVVLAIFGFAGLAFIALGLAEARMRVARAKAETARRDRT